MDTAEKQAPPPGETDGQIVLVTGAAGFLGSFLCEALVKRHRVIGIDNFITGSVENLRLLLQSPNFTFLRHDITEPLELERSPDLRGLQLPLRGIQQIYHLGCPTSPKDYDKLPVPTILTNSLGTKNILDVALHYRSRFLHASSSAVYGDRRPGKPYFREGYWGYINPLGPRRAYEEGKRFAESMVLTYHDAYGLETRIARIFPSYGPRMRLSEGRVIPDFIKHAVLNEPITVFGDEHMTTTYCYVSDTIDGLLRLMDSSWAEPVNIGNPLEYKLVDVAKKVVELTGASSEVRFGEPLPYLTKQGLPDISVAREQLGWLPLVNLDDGLRKTIGYMQSNWNRLQLTDVVPGAAAEGREQ